MVFDVGGVFVDLDPDARNAILTSSKRWDPGLPVPAAIRELNTDFRLGRIDDAVYVDRAAQFYGLSHHDVYRAETSLLKGVLQPMAALVPTLRAQHRVVCLSNTQAIHWRHILDHMLGADFFDACYLSHEMGLEKPDPAIYRKLAEDENVGGNDIVFVDDTAENIEAALALGWPHSIHHVTPDQTIATIKRLLDC
ncbi:putative hydrolase of the HAD superfamily [Neorhizobium galegae]|uniref:HAD family hydrolase n=1 Tax=Neorhizobium galegae TaxID=399 RepID=UPI001AE6771E|nr:HAD-IA family hydrolase [Neorhizobium galegae]MBP2550959.1 putative hydrolase of the HAD superfamily [Neorhizobium galegae]